MIIKYTLLFLVLFSCCKSAEPTQNNTSYWSVIKIDGTTPYLPSEYESFELNEQQLISDLEENKKVDLPLPNLGIQRVSVVNSGTMSPELAKKFPNIKSYRIVSDNNENIGAIDINSSGFYAMISIDNITYFINPVTKKNNQYICYDKQNASKDLNNPFIDQVIK